LRSTIQLYATSSIGNADKALDQLKEVLNKVLDEGFTIDQIQRAQEVWKQKRKAYLGVEKDFASTLVDSLDDGYDYAAMDKFDEKILSIDAKEATDVLRKYVKPSSVVWATGQGL
jgi:predicted Zn-dependent peptidase